MCTILDNGYSTETMHPALFSGRVLTGSVQTLHTHGYIGSPIIWRRDTPEDNESGSAWVKRTENNDFLIKVETITKMLYLPLVQELTAQQMPLFVFQWGVWPGRIALHLFPFKPERVCFLNVIARKFYKIDGQHTVDNDPVSSSESTGVSLRWLGKGEGHEPSFWTNLPHPCMSGSISNFGLRGLQVALNIDEKAGITEWKGSATQKHLETFLFHLVCAEFVLMFMLLDAHEKESRIQSSYRALECLLSEIGQSPIFCLAETPLVRSSLAATTEQSGV